MTSPSKKRPQGGITIVVGAQWGDEGKGKWIDWIAGGADVVARYQGGNNAGHTLYVKGQKVVLHQIPSGIFHEGRKCVLGAGVVINPGELVREMEKVAAFAKVTPDNLWLSARAHVITPWHVFMDGRREAVREASSGSAIGTTKRGIGPTYSEKTARSGLRLGEFVNPVARQLWVASMASTVEGFAAHLASDFNSHASEWQAFAKVAERLAPFVCDAEARVRQCAAGGKKILMEGAQGTLLDLDHGTFPFVTSSSTIAAGACASLGLPPRDVTGIYGIAKAYVTRVGAGPFPTELLDEMGNALRERGQEFGATTGRPRRCGWFDAVAMRYAQDVNGFDGVILNKFDILSGMDELKIAVAYEHLELGRIEQFPWNAEVLAACKPVYRTFKGWHGELPKKGGIEALPKEARDYIKAIEELSGIKVVGAGTGPGRDEALLGSDLVRLVTFNA